MLIPGSTPGRHTAQPFRQNLYAFPNELSVRDAPAMLTLAARPGRPLDLRRPGHLDRRGPVRVLWRLQYRLEMLLPARCLPCGLVRHHLFRLLRPARPLPNRRHQRESRMGNKLGRDLQRDVLQRHRPYLHPQRDVHCRDVQRRTGRAARRQSHPPLASPQPHLQLRPAGPRTHLRLLRVRRHHVGHNIVNQFNWSVPSYPWHWYFYIRSPTTHTYSLGWWARYSFNDPFAGGLPQDRYGTGYHRW